MDREYGLNSWPALPGLRYSVEYGSGTCSTIQDDSLGRGSIKYVETTAGKVRVDSYVIPLAEIGRKAGDKIRFAFYSDSPKLKLTLNSIEYIREGTYYPYDLPWAAFHKVTLADRPAILDSKKIPDGRDSK